MWRVAKLARFLHGKQIPCQIASRVALFFEAYTPERIPGVWWPGGPLPKQVRQLARLPQNPTPQNFYKNVVRMTMYY